MAARSGRFSSGLRPFGGGTLDANAAFILPPPPTPTAPPARTEPPPRGTGQAPKPVIPGYTRPLVGTIKRSAAAPRPITWRPGMKIPAPVTTIKKSGGTAPRRPAPPVGAWASPVIRPPQRTA